MAPPAPIDGILTERLDHTDCPHCGQPVDIGSYSLFEDIRCPECFDTFKAPGKFGSFLLIDLLGRGGMGAVYLAEDQTLRRHVALKVMRKEFGSDERFYASLVNEAQAAARLNHVNVAQVYSFGQENGQPFIVMELVQGARLDELLSQGDAVEEETVLRTAIDVAQGLEAAHTSGLVHGDIKPANILYDESGRAKIVDFGLAGQAGQSADSGQVWGTPYYIAPEKARKKREDHRSDQYSFGCTLWHVLIGRPPFDGKTPTDVVLARMDREPPLLQEADPTLSTRTSELVQRMMDLNPARRYPTYASLLADLHQALEALPAWQEPLKAHTQKTSRRAGKKKPRGPSTSPDPSAPSAETKKGSMGWVITVIILLVAGGAAYYFLGYQPGTPPPAAPAGGGAPARPTSSAANPSAVDGPFTASQLRRLQKAEEAFANGLDFRGEGIFQQLYAKTSAQSVARPWLELMQAARLTAQGESALAAENLGRLEQSTSEGALPAAPLGLLLTGASRFEEFQRAHPAAPLWYLDLARYCAGVHQLAEGQQEIAQPLLEAYTQRTPAVPAWAYVARGTARRLLEGEADSGSSVSVAKPPAARPPSSPPSPAGPRKPYYPSGPLPTGSFDVLLENDFESGTLEGWTARGDAGLYKWPGKPAENAATSGIYALDEEKGAQSELVLSAPLPLASGGYDQVTFSFTHNWIGATSTRRLEVQYAASGKDWKTIGRVTGSHGSPAHCMLTRGSGAGEWAFTDQARFRLYLSDNGGGDIRVRVDDVVIRGYPAKN